MAKKSVKTTQSDERLENVEGALNRTEQWFENNSKMITIVLVAIVVIVLGVIGYLRYIKAPREIKAQDEMFMAQRYFQMDSLNLALNGDGNFYGFLDIIDQYGSTKAGNLSHYYAGICYLNLGDFESAIAQLKEFSGKDEIVTAMATGALGDAYMEIGDQQKAVDFYKKAATIRTNDFTSPLFLLKTGQCYEMMGDYENALKHYESVKKEYPSSQDAREIDKYIGRIKEKLGK
ncbi:MAG: tetratricopeptide repeat protein [Bacteroidales bacterium]|nr:tetratricopeptide repeat protein [Bacteroidales bacterium]